MRWYIFNQANSFFFSIRSVLFLIKYQTIWISFFLLEKERGCVTMKPDMSYKANTWNVPTTTWLRPSLSALLLLFVHLFYSYLIHQLLNDARFFFSEFLRLTDFLFAVSGECTGNLKQKTPLPCACVWVCVMCVYVSVIPSVVLYIYTHSTMDGLESIVGGQVPVAPDVGDFF